LAEAVSLADVGVEDELLGAIERFQMGFVLPRGIIGPDVAPRVPAEDFGAKFGEGGINPEEFLAGIDVAVDGIVLAVRVEFEKKSGWFRWLDASIRERTPIGLRRHASSGSVGNGT
jgi:hypothetical protein